MMNLQTLAAMAVGVLTATLGGFEAHAQTLQAVLVAHSWGGVPWVHGGETLVRMRVKGRGAQQASPPWYRALMLPIAPSVGRTTTRRPGSIWATMVSGVLAHKS